MFSYAPVVRLSVYSADAPVWLLLFALTLHHLSQSPAQNVDCDWYLPVPPLCLLCSCRRSSLYCYCCCCRFCVGATSFYLYRLLCPILAAGVLMLCYVVAAEVLLFSPTSPPLEPPPLYYRFSDISSLFRQAPDCSDILIYITRALKNRLYRLPPKKDYHVYITRSIYHYAYARQTQDNWKKETKNK